MIPHNPDNIEEIRFSGFIGELVSDYLACNRPADERLFRRHYGGQGSAAFWDIFLYGTRSLPIFILTLPKLAAKDWDDIDRRRFAYQNAIIDAFQSGQAFFKGDIEQLQGAAFYRDIKKPDLIKVAARDAVEWLAADPWKKHLLPASLLSYLLGKSETVIKSNGFIQPLRRGPRGRKQDVRPRVIAEMLADLQLGKTDPETLENDSQLNLEITYKANRETCRKAREKALSLFVANSITDK